MGKAAVLIFADAVERDLSRRRWPSQLAPLLALPDVGGAGADVHRFTPDRQRGRTFGRRLSNAVADLAAAGYERIVIVGRDCPDLKASDVTAALAALENDQTRLALGPDHAGGCWLIGLRAADLHLLDGVKWRRGTDRAELTRRAGESAVALLDEKIDLDGTADLRIVHRTLEIVRALALLGLAPMRCPVPRAVHAQTELVRHRWQLPPPARRAA